MAALKIFMRRLHRCVSEITLPSIIDTCGAFASAGVGHRRLSLFGGGRIAGCQRLLRTPPGPRLCRFALGRRWLLFWCGRLCFGVDLVVGRLAGCLGSGPALAGGLGGREGGVELILVVTAGRARPAFGAVCGRKNWEVVAASQHKFDADQDPCLQMDLHC